MTFSGALSCLRDSVSASALLSGQLCIVVGLLCDVLSWPWSRSHGLCSVSFDGRLTNFRAACVVPLDSLH